MYTHLLFCYSHGIPQTLPGNCFIKIYRHLILLVYTSAIFPFEHSISVPTPPTPLLSNLSHLAVTVTSFFSSRCFKNLAVYYLESNRCADGGITCLNMHEIHFLMTASKFFFYPLFKYLDWLAYRPISSHILYIYVSISWTKLRLQLYNMNDL